MTSNRLAGAIIDALGEALPLERRMAASNDSTTLTVLGGFDPGRGSTYVYPESIGGGAGAFFDEDGMDAVHVHTVNSTNLPVEVLESAYPLHCTTYALGPDTGGPGRQRGGLGIVREVEALASGTSLTVRSDGHHFPAPGLAGGLAGSVTTVSHIGADGTTTVLGSKTTLTLDKGERVRIETLGGGGYGPPAARAIAAIAEELDAGTLTRARAILVYGKARVEAALALKG